MVEMYAKGNGQQKILWSDETKFHLYGVVYLTGTIVNSGAENHRESLAKKVRYLLVLVFGVDYGIMASLDQYFLT